MNKTYTFINKPLVDSTISVSSSRMKKYRIRYRNRNIGNNPKFTRNYFITLTGLFKHIEITYIPVYVLKAVELINQIVKDERDYTFTQKFNKLKEIK